MRLNKGYSIFGYSVKALIKSNFRRFYDVNNSVNRS